MKDLRKDIINNIRNILKKEDLAQWFEVIKDHKVVPLIIRKYHYLLIVIFSVTINILPWSSIHSQHIRPYNEHPRYWEFKGEPVLLLGGTDDDVLFFWEEDRLKKELDLLASVGGNFVRSILANRQIYDYHVFPFKQLADGKFDLNQWNPDYWNRFKRLLAETAKRDIIVQLELFDGHDYQSSSDRDDNFPQWDRNPFNPKNNINYDDTETTLPVVWTHGYHNQTHPFLLTVPGLNEDLVILKYQRRFIGKALDIALGYDHILYAIQNENWVEQEWSNHWAEFVREKAGKKGRQVYVGDMRFQPAAFPVLDHDFDFAELSQSASGVGTGGREHRNHRGEGHYLTIAREWLKLSDQPAPSNSVKQYGGTMGWTLGADEGVDRVWRSVFSGQAAVRFHRIEDPYGFGIGLNERAQNQLLSLRKLTDSIDIIRVQPHQRIAHLLSDRNLNEAYIMADPGRVYTVYFTDGGSVNLDVSDLDSDANVKWLDTEKGEWSKSEILTNNIIRLTPPSSGKWAAVISNQE